MAHLIFSRKSAMKRINLSSLKPSPKTMLWVAGVIAAILTAFAGLALVQPSPTDLKNFKTWEAEQVKKSIEEATQK